MLFGATGSIGRSVAAALVREGHEVVALVRPRSGVGGAWTPDEARERLQGIELRIGEASDPHSLGRDGFRGEHFDAVVSCLASRTGAPNDAWRIDYQAHVDILAAAQAAGASHMTLLSAICVQKPQLEFQRAKLAFEETLIDSGIAYSIVRPTAYFKSLSGQVERVRKGKPYLLVGDGRMTACKPISDDDLGRYIAECVDDAERWNRILPIGGPGPAITPREQAERLFALLGKPPKVASAPLFLFDAVIAALSLAGRLHPKLADKAELARIGRYYATESMLVLDPLTGEYSEALTPSAGRETLFDYYARLIRGGGKVELGDHAVF
jgi:divinyl chlorophyllide a 8-vinyl-reductase